MRSAAFWCVLAVSGVAAAEPAASRDAPAFRASIVREFPSELRCWGEGKIFGADEPARIAVLDGPSVIIEVAGRRYSVAAADSGRDPLPLCGHSDADPTWRKLDGQRVQLVNDTLDSLSTSTLSVRGHHPVLVAQDNAYWFRHTGNPHWPAEVERDGNWDALIGVSRGTITRYTSRGAHVLLRCTGRLVPTYRGERIDGPGVTLAPIHAPTGVMPVVRVIERDGPPSVELTGAAAGDELVVYYAPESNWIEPRALTPRRVAVDAHGTASAKLTGLGNDLRGQVVPFVVEVAHGTGDARVGWTSGVVDPKLGWCAGELVVGAELPLPVPSMVGATP